MKPSRYLILVSLGFELVGLVVGALLLGQMLDDKYKTKGLFVMGLLVACLISWFFHLLFLLKRLEKSGGDQSVEPEDS